MSKQDPPGKIWPSLGKVSLLTFTLTFILVSAKNVLTQGIPQKKFLGISRGKLAYDKTPKFHIRNVRF